MTKRAVALGAIPMADEPIVAVASPPPSSPVVFPVEFTIYNGPDALYSGTMPCWADCRRDHFAIIALQPDTGPLDLGIGRITHVDFEWGPVVFGGALGTALTRKRVPLDVRMIPGDTVTLQWPPQGIVTLSW